MAIRTETCIGWSSRPGDPINQWPRDQQYEEDQPPLAIEAPAYDELNAVNEWSFSTVKSKQEQEVTSYCFEPLHRDSWHLQMAWTLQSVCRVTTLKIAFKHAQEYQGPDYDCTDFWVVVNTVWKWLKDWNHSNRQQKNEK